MPYKNGQFQIPDDATEIQELASQIKGEFAKRDTRMRMDQDSYEMRGGITEGDITVTLNDGKVLVKKAAAMIAAKPPEIYAAARYPEDDTLAQSIEDFLYWWRYQAECEYMRGIRNPLVYDETTYILLRGWICGRLLLDPSNAKWPWSYSLLDPMTIYPRVAGNKTHYIVQRYRPTVAEVLGDFPEADAVLGDLPPQQYCEYTAIYTDTEYAVVVNNEFVKDITEHGYGFNPILISLAAGSPYHATEQHQDWQANMGTGILDAALTPIDDKEELALMMKTWLSKAAEPPAVLYTNKDDQTIAETIDLRSGGRMVFDTDGNTKLELLNPLPNIQDLMPLIQLFQASIDRSALGPQMFQDGPKMSSGFQEAVAAGSARDMIFPFVRGLERYYNELYYRVLKLFGDNAAAPISYTATDPQSGRRTAWNQLQPEQVQGADVCVEVQFRDVTPQNEMQKAQIGQQAAQSHILDLDTVRSKYFDVRNPTYINEKVLANLVLQDPQLIQRLSLAAAQNSADPRIAQGAAQEAQMQAAQAAQARAQAQAAQQAAAQGLPPPPPPPGAPPLPPQAPHPPGAPPPPGPGAGSAPLPTAQPPNHMLPNELSGAAGLPPGAPNRPGIGSPGAAAPAIVPRRG